MHYDNNRVSFLLNRNAYSVWLLYMFSLSPKFLTALEAMHALALINDKESESLTVANDKEKQLGNCYMNS